MSTSDLYLDRNRDVWRRVHNGSLVRLTLGGYISPAISAEKVEADCGPLHELAPIDAISRIAYPEPMEGN